MDVQKLITLGIVLAAGAYLGRYLLMSLKDVFAKNEGCGGGCSKCAFAKNMASTDFVSKGNGAKAANRPSGLIALSDIQTLPSKAKSTRL